jgi:ABC-type uncharacterized transport system ATPase subunit
MELMFLNEENTEEQDFEIYNERAITDEERKKLKDEDFALPEERKFPIHDKAHVQKAIQYFKYIPEAKRKEAAKRIKKAADKFGVHISEDSLIYKYLDEKR